MKSLKGLIVMLFALVLVSACESGSKDGTNAETIVVSPVAVSHVFPEEAKSGTQIYVTGINFGGTQGNNTLTVGGVVADQIISWADTLIIAYVPAGAGTGNVTVTIDGVAGAPGYLIVPWMVENPDNVAINTAPFDQGSPQLISDGRGGAIIAWHDLRSNVDVDIYVQRLDSAGKIMWGEEGVAISTAANDQGFVQLISDGYGGAIITWHDFRDDISFTYTNADIYAQRIDSSGSVLWEADGVAISIVADNQIYPQLISDGTGGVIIVWQDLRSGLTTADLYAQRIDSNGSVLWTADGIAINSAANNQEFPQLTSDGSGGGIVTWQDGRNGTDFDIYAQRINSNGAVLWTADGVAISTAPNGQFLPKLSNDGSGGSIITWQDYRNGFTNADLYAQRIDGSGSILWTADGVAISTAANDQEFPQLISDGSGGAIFIWQDFRSGLTNADIYAQRIGSSGLVLWMADGVPISTAANNQEFPQLIRDGSGGAIFTWQDFRSGLTNADIYAQRIGSSGSVLWMAEGTAICTAVNDQNVPQLISDGSGGAIITWKDHRSGTFGDIYSQGITASGRQ